MLHLIKCINLIRYDFQSSQKQSMKQTFRWWWPKTATTVQPLLLIDSGSVYGKSKQEHSDQKPAGGDPVQSVQIKQRDEVWFRYDM